ncbi:MAG: response regulator receiver protein [Bacteroidetes bacterium]|jgi:CheY-like chemotaxis protein|nr:response regulator receiver protein [Bacteroidota bacterium]
MREKFTIVIADDDIDDQALMKEGFEDCKVKVEVNAVYNGLQLMDYLLRREAYKTITTSPDLILLDLNMPLMDGFNVLSEIKEKTNLTIPVYVITTSENKADKKKSLELGAKGFFSKGYSSADIKRVMSEICKECFE